MFIRLDTEVCYLNPVIGKFYHLICQQYPKDKKKEKETENHTNLSLKTKFQVANSPNLFKINKKLHVINWQNNGNWLSCIIVLLMYIFVKKYFFFLLCSCNNWHKACLQFKSVNSTELQRNYNSLGMANWWCLIKTIAIEK